MTTPRLAAIALLLACGRPGRVGSGACQPGQPCLANRCQDAG